MVPVSVTPSTYSADVRLHSALATHSGTIMLRRLPSRSGGSRHLSRWWMTRFLAATASATYDRRCPELSLVPPTLCALLLGLGEPYRPPQLLTFPVASWCHAEASTPRHRSLLRTRRHVGPMVDTTSHLARAAPVTRPLGQRNAHDPERLWLARLHLVGGVDRECTTDRHTPAAGTPVSRPYCEPALSR